jgi:hypothetical protein
MIDIIQSIAIGLLAFIQARHMLSTSRIANLLDTHAKQIGKAFELLSTLARIRK